MSYQNVNKRFGGLMANASDSKAPAGSLPIGAHVE